MVVSVVKNGTWHVVIVPHYRLRLTPVLICESNYLHSGAVLGTTACRVAALMAKQTTLVRELLCKDHEPQFTMVAVGWVVA